MRAAIYMYMKEEEGRGGERENEKMDGCRERGKMGGEGRESIKNNLPFCFVSSRHSDT